MFPFLTRQVHGEGALWAVPIPFFSAHGEQTPPVSLMRTVMEIVLPSDRRALMCDASEDAEVVLRRRSDGGLIYHVVNMSPGTRTVCETGGRRHVSIHDIAPIPAHRVRIRCDRQPVAVTVEPGGHPVEDWSFRNGALSFTMPVTEIHAMAVCR